MESVATGLTFRLPSLNCVPRQFENYIHGEWIDRIPLAIRADWEGDMLRISHDYKESLRIIVPWEIEGLGVFFLKTVSLPQRQAAYDLALEIARGTVGRLVDQAENWKAAGLELSEETENQLMLVKRNLRRATFRQGDERYQYATVAIGASIHLMNEVGMQFAHFVFDLRRQDKQPNTSLLGAPWHDLDFPPATGFHQYFNTALIPEDASRITPESRSRVATLCRNLHRRGINTCGEPVLRFAEQGPADFDSIDDAECSLIQQADCLAESSWSACKLLMPVSQLGYLGPTAWNDQEQIHLTYELTTYLKEKIAEVPLIIGIDQPFGESRLEHHAKSPLQLADTLIRMETPIAAFCLEINLGYYPDGTWIRDLFAFNDLLDSWSQFDFPLIVQFRIPGGVRGTGTSTPDPIAAAGFDSQASWLEKLASLSLAKQNVAGVFYGQLFESPDDRFAGAGLISSRHEVKPALNVLQKIHREMA